MGRLIASIRTVFRMLREFITRQVTRLWASFRRATSLTTQSAKVVPKALSAVGAASAKPTKRSDYVETGRLFIAKKLIVMSIVVLLAIGVIIYFIGWPWFVSRFLVLKMPAEDKRAADYDGRVELYYDEAMEHLLFRGTLEEGKKTGEGELYQLDGMPVYKGEFEKDAYNGAGRRYNDKGQLVYNGQFAGGMMEGNGTQYGGGGSAVYVGQFAADERSGFGREYDDGALVFEGGFKANMREGTGRAFDTDGNLIFAGEYKDGLRKGEGTEYYAGGKVKYKGEFAEDAYSGEGVLYYEDGQEHYSGGFDGGVFSGEGTLHLSKTEWKSGGFTGGKIAGNMTWYRDGKLYYEGNAIDSLPHGSGRLYNDRGAVVFTGAFAAGEIDAEALIGMTAEDIRACYAEVAYEEEMTETGFNIRNREAGIEVFCSFATEDEEAMARRVLDVTTEIPRLLAEDDEFYPRPIADMLNGEQEGGNGGTEELKTAEDMLLLLPRDLDRYLDLQTAIVTYQANSEILSAIEMQLALRSAQLTELTNAQLMGTASSKDVSAMQMEVDRLDAALNKARLNMQRAAESMEKLTGITEEELAQYDLSDIFMEDDPALIVQEELLGAMITADISMYIEEFQQRADDTMFTLNMLYADMELSKKMLAALEEGLPDVKDRYALGKSERAEYCDAMCEYYGAVADRYTDLMGFTTEMYNANRASAGYLCLFYDKFTDIYRPFRPGQ